VLCYAECRYTEYHRFSIINHVARKWYRTDAWATSMRRWTSSTTSRCRSTLSSIANVGDKSVTENVTDWIRHCFDTRATAPVERICFYFNFQSVYHRKFSHKSITSFVFETYRIEAFMNRNLLTRRAQRAKLNSTKLFAPLFVHLRSKLECFTLPSIKIALKTGGTCQSGAPIFVLGQPWPRRLG
jgi:hypothetical protein